MAIVFRSGGPNFPKDGTELKKRLAEVNELINKDRANIEFAEAAFKLMEDYGLITEENIKFLCSAKSCRNFDHNFRFPRNSSEGALRYVIDDKNIMGADGLIRFYDGNDRRVELNGDHYLISNDWYKDNNAVPNKRAFYNWLEPKVRAACKKHWAENPPTPETVSDKPEPKKFSSENNSVEPVANKVPSENDSETEKLLNKVSDLVTNLDKRIENLEEILIKMKNDLEEIKNMWK